MLSSSRHQPLETHQPQRGGSNLPLVLCIDPQFDRFALTARRLQPHWRVGWADTLELANTWFRQHHPEAVVFFFLEPTAKSLQLVQAIRAKTKAPLIAHLPREAPDFQLSLQLVVDRISAGPLSYPTLDAALQTLVSESLRVQK